MSRKLLYLFAAVVLLLVIAGTILVLLQRRSGTNTNTTNQSTTVLPNVNVVVLNTNQPANTNTALTNAAQDPRAEVQQLGSSFASIYGSLSSQNNYANVTDLYFYMTPALKANQETFVAQQLSQQQDTSLYHGITSIPRVVNVTAYDLNAGTATVAITLQRVETNGSTSSTYNQDITLSFERLQNAWKVARIVWGAKQ